MHGFGYVWISQDIGNDALFIKHFKQRIQDCYLHKWHMDKNNAGKGQHYKHFKSLLNPELYLNSFLLSPYAGYIVTLDALTMTL